MARNKSLIKQSYEQIKITHTRTHARTHTYTVHTVKRIYMNTITCVLFIAVSHYIPPPLAQESVQNLSGGLRMWLEEWTGMECCSGDCESCSDWGSSSVSSCGPNDELSSWEGIYTCELDGSAEVRFWMWSTWRLSILPSGNFIMYRGYVKGPRISSTIPSSHLDPWAKFSTNTVSFTWNFRSLECTSWLSCYWICQACTVSSTA
jgi:hypothetical protein